MPDAATVLSAFRDELVAAGLVRKASVAGPLQGPPYPMLVEPREGAPAPGELDDGLHDHDELVVSIFNGGGVSPANGYEAASRRVTIVDVRYRSGQPAPAGAQAGLMAAMGLDAAIRALLVQPATNYGYGFMLGGVFCHAATPFAEMGPLDRGRDRAFDHVARWAIETQP